MTASTRGSFDAQDVTIAVAVALLAQLGFVAAFSMPSPRLVEAEISNENAQPIAVAITPVLKLGSKTPDKVPSKWERRRPAPTKKAPETPLPSTRAEKTPEAVPTTSVPEAGAAPVAEKPAPAPSEPVNPTAPESSATASPAASTEGSELGAAHGTETDPLKARAADMYRAQLAEWFAAHFHIQGKIPFDTLKGLHATASIAVAPDRTVGGFTIDRPSGDSTFDSEVRSTLSQIQSSHVELPAPPPMYPDILKTTLAVGFECTLRKRCE